MLGIVWIVYDKLRFVIESLMRFYIENIILMFGEFDLSKVVIFFIVFVDGFLVRFSVFLGLLFVIVEG